MLLPPPAHPKHFHFTRQYQTRNYIVFDTVTNASGDTFRFWLPKGLNVDEDHLFPAFCEKRRYSRPEVKPEPRRSKPYYLKKKRHSRKTCRKRHCAQC